MALSRYLLANSTRHANTCCLQRFGVVCVSLAYPAHNSKMSCKCDHFHEKSLMRFDRNTLVLTSKPSEKKLRKLGFNNIEALKSGIQKNIGDLTIKTHDAGFPYNYLWTFSFEII